MILILVAVAIALVLGLMGQELAAFYQRVAAVFPG
jgi:hypothetical protein